jgi:hypothetical protein
MFRYGLNNGTSVSFAHRTYIVAIFSEPFCPAEVKRRVAPRELSSNWIIGDFFQTDRKPKMVPQDHRKGMNTLYIHLFEV